MVRILPGDSWKLNPSYLTELKQLDERTARRFSPTAILDVLGIEVDGANVGQGLSETAIFAVLEDLAGVVLRLCREPEGRGQVSLGEGRTELVLGRRGPKAALSVVSLSRPARILAGELEVDLSCLAQATSACARTLLADLDEINPALAATPFSRRLAKRAGALLKASQVASGPTAEPCAERPPLARGTPPGSAEGAVVLGFSLHDERGRIDGYHQGADLYSLLVTGQLWLRDGAGTEVRLPAQPPFLLLTELARCAGELVSSVQGGEKHFRSSLGAGAWLEVDFETGQARLADRALASKPLALARAFLEGALDFGAMLVAQNPAQSDNAYLSTLCDGARDGLAHLREVEGGDLFDDRSLALPPPAARQAPDAPLGKGTLKRLRFRTAWSGTDTGERARGLKLHRDALMVLGRRGASWLDPRRGGLLAQRAGESAEFYDGGILLADRSRLTGFSTRGRALFLRDQPGHDQPALTASAGTLRAGPLRQPATLCVFEGHVAAAIYSATGRTAWQLRVPQAVRLSAGVQAERVFVAADNGFLYALEAAAGQVVFRVRTGIAFEGPLTVGARTVASLGRSEGGLWLSAVDALTGRPRFSQPLAMKKAGAPVLFRQKLLVGGSGEGISTVAAFGPNGRELFRTSLEARAGLPAITVHRGRIYCGLRDGSVTCLEANGVKRWAAGPCGIELDRPIAPVIRRDVLIAAGDPLRALDPETGRVLAELPPTQGLSALAVGRGLDVYTVDDDGVAACHTLATHLSVVG